jgi:prepilin-type N-terminal cleavage/methylation domain-containing protein
MYKPMAGFPLVELMVVIALIAIIAGFTVAEINSTSNQLKNCAFTLRAKMQQAKLLAVKENCNVKVGFDISGNFYGLWRDVDGTYELIEKVVLPKNIAIGAVPSGEGGPGTGASGSGSAPSGDPVTFSGDSVSFSPQGTASNGWVYLYAPQKLSAGTYAVGSNNVGRIQTRKWSTGGGKWR